MSRAAGADVARDIADAVLYEGYVLFPYRASAAKNRYRWQWGVVVPEPQVAVGATEPASVTCQVPVQHGDGAAVTVTVRFLHVCHRQVEDADGAPADQVEVDGRLHVTWDEGVEQEVVVPRLDVADLMATPHAQGFSVPGADDVTTLPDGSRVRRTRHPVDGVVEVAATAVGEQAARLTVGVRNVTAWSQGRAHRDEVLRRAMVGTHLVLTVDGGRFGSVVDPAAWAEGAAAGCRSRHVHPVLVGDPGRDDCVLAAPIILEDHPEIAPESPGPSFDGLEIEELLTLCVQGLTDAEKREARATDRRAAELVDRADHLPPEVLERLHGAVRDVGSGPTLLPEPEAEVDADTAAFFGVGEEPVQRTTVDGHVVEVGDRVRLRPGRRADVHDLFAADRLATVERIVSTVDEDTLLAVTIVDDPAADLHRWYGRFQYFHSDEVVPVTDDGVVRDAEAPDERLQT